MIIYIIGYKMHYIRLYNKAPVAQLDRVPDYGSGG